MLRRNNQRLTRIQNELQDKVNEKTGSTGGMRQAFLKFDANHDGTINHDEFKQGLRHGLGVPISTPDYETLLKHVDSDNSGIIDYFEFADKMKPKDVSSMKPQHQFGANASTSEKGIWAPKTPETMREGQELTEAERMDRNLDVKLKRAIETKSEDLLTEFRRFDVDRDSMLTYAELKRGLDRLEVKFEPKEFKRLCARMDPDGTGYTDYGEFARYVQSAELAARGDREGRGLGSIAGDNNSKQAQKAVDRMNARGANYVLSAEEQEDAKLHKMILQKAQGQGTKLNKLFGAFDDDSNGTVSHAEFRRGIERGLNLPMSDNVFGRLVNSVDADNSGNIDYLEFVSKMNEQEFTGRHDNGQLASKVPPRAPGTGGSRPPGTGSKPPGTGRSRQGSSGGRLSSGERLARAREREESKAEVMSVRDLPDSVF